MANRTLRDLFDQARVYLDTDDLNFPDDLCNILLQRIWAQVVSMEREWRFLQKRGTLDVTAGTVDIDMAFFTDPANTAPTPAARLYTLRWAQGLVAARGSYGALAWVSYTDALKVWGEQQGTPACWSEINDGPDRKIRLFPSPNADGNLLSDFYADLTYPASPVGGGPYDTTFAPLPDEWDSALLEGLLAEMYMREEDPDLYNIHRQLFLEQTGTIRTHWRRSIDAPIVVAGNARVTGPATGFNDVGAFTAPAMR